MANITHSEQEQSNTFDGLVNEMIKQGQVIPTPQVPGGDTVDADTAAVNAEATPTKAKVSDATKNGPVAKLPQNTVTNAIANQGQLLPIPQVTSESSDTSLKDIKNAISNLSGQVDNSSSTGGGGGGGSSGGGDGGLGDIASTAMSIVGWIICTELMKQGKMPKKWWIKGAPIFAAYPDVVKQGYYLWAIPCVGHLRAYPNSLLSRLLCLVFNWRAQSIAEKTTFRGAMVTVVLWPICYIIGTGLKLFNLRLDWFKIYEVR